MFPSIYAARFNVISRVKAPSIFREQCGELGLPLRSIYINNHNPGDAPCCNSDVRFRVGRPPSFYCGFIFGRVLEPFRRQLADRVLADIFASWISATAPSLLRPP